MEPKDIIQAYQTAMREFMQSYQIAFYIYVSISAIVTMCFFFLCRDISRIRTILEKEADMVDIHRDINDIKKILEKIQK
jgi:hypothetical protein